MFGKFSKFTWPLLVVGGVALSGFSYQALAQNSGDQIFDEIFRWTQSEVQSAGATRSTDSGEDHSAIFVGDNARYDDGRGEVKRTSFVEGELFKSGNLALTGEMTREVIEEIKMNTRPEDWYDQINSAKKAVGKQSLDSWYQELAECKTVCAQIVVRMMAKHFEAISKLPHFFVMFRTGSRSIDPSYNEFLDQIADYLASSEDLNVMVIGRASRSGDRAFNRELSRKRADSIKYRLMDRNIPADQIKVVYLGYEPPQISDKVQELYQLDSQMVNLGHSIAGKNNYEINQSALIALVKK